MQLREALQAANWENLNFFDRDFLGGYIIMQHGEAASQKYQSQKHDIGGSQIKHVLLW